jgi:hypothetical protein
MTRDERRAKCIETTADALHDMTDDNPFPRRAELKIATFILDSLHGIARINPVEATEEMYAAGWNEGGTDYNMSEGDLRLLFEAMSAAGDLTNPPEGKP